MNRINQLFQDSPKNLLSVYFCAGFPTLDSTADVIRTLEKNGVNMVEIGIPFSDPMADGIVIQDAATRALRNGMSLRILFEQLQDIRRDVRIPLILMGYLNPIMHFGFEAFCRKCTECGIDGVIIPDLPFREYEENYKAVAQKYDIRVIMLITPETSEKRIREIDAHTDGFIYMVSSAATTGAAPVSRQSGSRSPTPSPPTRLAAFSWPRWAAIDSSVSATWLSRATPCPIRYSRPRRYCPSTLPSRAAAQYWAAATPG